MADLGLGGAQQVVVNLANGFAKNGHKVGVFDVYPGLREAGVVKKLNRTIDLIFPSDYKYKPSLYHKAANSFFYRTGLNKEYDRQKKEKKHQLEAIEWVKKNQPSVVNSHVWWADRWVYQHQSWLPDNWWITMHGSYTAMMKHHKKEVFLRESPQVLLASSGFIYLSDNELETIKQIPGWDDKPRYKVPNGLPEISTSSSLKREHLGLDQDDFVLLCASRAIREKGWRELVEAIGLLRDEHPNVRLLLAGDGPFRRELEEATQFPEVRFLGYRPDVAGLIGIADCVVLPSYTEAFPTILLEALQQAVPSIASSVGEVEELLTLPDGSKGGITIPLSRNGTIDTQVLADAIRQMMDPTHYAGIKKNIEQHDFRFTVERQVATYENIFQEGHP